MMGVNICGLHTLPGVTESEFKTYSAVCQTFLLKY